MERIANGLKLTNLAATIKTQKETLQKAVEDLRSQVTQITEDFNLFKQENDLDKRFTETQDRETRMILLQKIKELLTEPQWADPDQNLSNTLNKQDTSYVLRGIQQANQDLKSKLQQLVTQPGSKEHALPLNQFIEEFDRSLRMLKSTTVELSSEKASNLLSRLCRQVRNQGSQTEQMETVLSSFNSRIEELLLKLTVAEKETKLAKQENDQIHAKMCQHETELQKTQQELKKRQNECTELEAIQKESRQEYKQFEYKHSMTLKKLDDHAARIKEFELTFKRQAKELEKMKKLQEKLMQKVVELGGPDILDKLLREHEAAYSDEPGEKRARKNRDLEGQCFVDPALRESGGLDRGLGNSRPIFKDGKYFVKGPNGEMIEVDQSGNPVALIKHANGKCYKRGPNGELIEVDASGKPIIVKGPGGKSYIRGPNGELIECDASGKPIKGGQVVKIGKDGKPLFGAAEEQRRDANGNLIPAGKRVRMRADGTYSVLSDDESNREDGHYDTKINHKTRAGQKRQDLNAELPGNLNLNQQQVKEAQGSKKAR